MQMVLWDVGTLHKTQHPNIPMPHLHNGKMVYILWCIFRRHTNVPSVLITCIIAAVSDGTLVRRKCNTESEFTCK